MKRQHSGMNEDEFARMIARQAAPLFQELQRLKEDLRPMVQAEVANQLERQEKRPPITKRKRKRKIKEI